MGTQSTFPDADILSSVVAPLKRDSETLNEVHDRYVNPSFCSASQASFKSDTLDMEI